MKKVYPLSEKTVLTCDSRDGQMFVGYVDLEEAVRGESLEPAAVVAACCILGVILAFAWYVLT